MVSKVGVINFSLNYSSCLLTGFSSLESMVLSCYHLPFLLIMASLHSYEVKLPLLPSNI